MSRPRSEANVPWFDVAHYAASYQMDAADWYLNLALRGAIARTDADDAPNARALVRGAQPVIRRGDASRQLLLDKGTAGADFVDMLAGREPRAGIEYMSATELYFFERRLPQAIREFGEEYVHGKTPVSEAPAGFFDPVDRLFEPRFLNAFVRINLSLPDKTLIADLKAFLARERKALAAIDGTQPFAAALHKLGNCKQANLDSFANYGVLPFLDVEQWRIDVGAKVPDAAFARLLGIEPDALPEARKKAELVLDDFVLRGWLLDAARAAVREPRTVLRKI